ncbi:metal ABC transporter permease [Halomonas sp. M1]|nr:metal ABC transporter permease [Halomonas sp. M1]WFE71124.1 metal ABC transporter permease [Halomonas sp. M1]
MLPDMLWLPLLTGVGMTLLLALAGVGLFLKGSAWQALALSQWAAVGGVAASALSWPVLPIALGVSGAMMWLLRVQRQAEHAALASFLAGLALVTLLAANAPQASLAAARWAEGQLYFVVPSDTWAVIGLTLVSLLLFWTLRRTWLRGQLAPNVASWVTPSLSARLLEAGWLVAVIVMGAMVFGVPAALSTLLFPAWMSALQARCLQHWIQRTILLGLITFMAAWWLSLWWDQPFAPMLIITHVAMGMLLWGLRLLRVLPGRPGG